MDLRKLSFKNILRAMNLYLPFLGAGVRVSLIDEKNYIVKASMNLNVLNKNYVGTHFGGSLYSMVDPFYMLILMRKIGNEYLVWDKSATIQFRRPGKGRVEAIFDISNEEVERIKTEVLEKGKCEPEFEVLIKDENGDTVASVSKKLWVKRKN